MSDDFQKAFLDAIEKEPRNYSHRYVYADWLDEQGEHEEADRQRKFEKADKWLREFAKKHTDFDFDFDCSDEYWADDAPEWPLYDAETNPYLAIGATTTSANDPAPDCDFWDGEDYLKPLLFGN